MTWIVATGGFSALSGFTSVVAGLHGFAGDAQDCGFWSIFEAMCCVALIAMRSEESVQ